MDEDLVKRLQEGKKRMAERCTAIADKWTPPGCIVWYRKDLSGRMGHGGKVMWAPRPITRKSLYLFLHECAHYHLGHNGKSGKPRHREEYEAEKWAHEKMREAGIAVPRAMTRRAKCYVAWRIDMAVRRGAKRIDKEAKRYAG